MTQKYAILVGGPNDGSRIAVERFTPEVHVTVYEPLDFSPLAGDEPIPRDEGEIRMPVGVYLAVRGPVRPREYALWTARNAWLPDHEVCMYVFIGERP